MSKADELIKKAIFFEKLSAYLDRKTFLQRLATDPESPNEQIVNVDPSENQYTPGKDPVLTNDFNQKNKYPPIDPKIQEALNKISFSPNSPTGPFIITPLKVDGQKGPNTVAAIKSFMGRYKIPNSTSEQQVYKQIFNILDSMKNKKMFTGSI